MHSVEYKFRRSISQMIFPGDRILAAVSGGPDSVVMLHLLNKLKSESSDFFLAIAHLNHLSRGEDSNRDADFVAQLCKKMSLENFIEEIDVATLSHNMNTSYQEAARDVRYSFLNRTLSGWGGNIIALGHNADDQAETMLINILRGSGLLGLAGTPAKKDHFIRPLHNCFRNEIEDYIKIHNLDFCYDVTNHKKNYLRNRIRLELIPFLESYNPKIKSSLIETSRLLTDDEDYLQEQVDKIISQAEGNAQKLGFSKLKVDFPKKQHPALQKRLIRQAILFAKGNLRSISSRHISNILRFINFPVGKREIHLPGSLTAICAGRKLSFCKTDHNKSDMINDTVNKFSPIDINVPGWTNIGVRGLRFNAKLISIDNTTDYFTNPNLAYLDYEKTGSQIKVRFFRPGDRFVPLGMKGNKKLKSFFIDEKIPQNERMSVPLLISKDDDIIWVYEKRIGENYRITDKTRKVLVLEGSGAKDHIQNNLALG